MKKQPLLVALALATLGCVFEPESEPSNARPADAGKIIFTPAPPAPTHAPTIDPSCKNVYNEDGLIVETICHSSKN